MTVHYYHKGVFGHDNQGKVEIADERLLSTKYSTERVQYIV